MAGIGIYLNEYEKLFSEKSHFFIPDDLEDILKFRIAEAKFSLTKI